MKKLKLPLALILSFVTFYNISPFIGVTVHWIYWMYCFSPVAVIWFVIKVLKDGKHSGKSLKDGYFYEDADHIRSESEMG